jgi:hypothetical protein
MSTDGILPQTTGAVSFKRVLDGGKIDDIHHQKRQQAANKTQNPESGSLQGDW